MSRPTHSLLVLIVFLHVTGLGLIAPVLPELVTSLAGSERAGASWVGVLTAAAAATQFLFAPVLGTLSDRFGRRPVLLASVLGATTDFALVLLAPSLWWLVLGRLIGGAAGGVMPMARAFAADLTGAPDRAWAFARLSAAFALGFVVGPALGGLLGEAQPRLPFLIAAGLSLVNAAITGWGLDESRPVPGGRTPALAALSPLRPLLWLWARRDLRRLTLTLVASACRVRRCTAPSCCIRSPFWTGPHSSTGWRWPAPH